MLYTGLCLLVVTVESRGLVPQAAVIANQLVAPAPLHAVSPAPLHAGSPAPPPAPLRRASARPPTVQHVKRERSENELKGPVSLRVGSEYGFQYQRNSKEEVQLNNIAAISSFEMVDRKLTASDDENDDDTTNMGGNANTGSNLPNWWSTTMCTANQMHRGGKIRGNDVTTEGNDVNTEGNDVNTEGDDVNTEGDDVNTEGDDVNSSVTEDPADVSSEAANDSSDGNVTNNTDDSTTEPPSKKGPYEPPDVTSRNPEHFIDDM